jgi:hypothetical protein
VTLSASPSTAVLGKPVTLTAAVSPQAAGQATGTVSFLEGTVELGTEPVSSGKASLLLSSLPVGTHSITAKYSGDTNFQASASPELQLQVNPPDRRASSNAFVILSGTSISIRSTNVIDSNTSVVGAPLIATLAAPISAHGRRLGQEGANAILGLGYIDREGINAGRPTLTILLMQLDIDGKIYQLRSGLQIEGAPQGRAGHIHIPANAVLTFKLQSPITIDSSATTRSSNRR